jgi:transposase
MTSNHRGTAAQRADRGSLLSRSRNQRQRLSCLETATAFTGEVESFVSAGVCRGETSKNFGVRSDRDLPARRASPPGAAWIRRRSADRAGPHTRGDSVIGLPSLAVMDRSTETRIWLATAPADMRCGFDRLAELAQVVTNQNPMDGHLFLFRGRSGDRLKILYWDRDGYALRTNPLRGAISCYPSIRCPRRWATC